MKHVAIIGCGQLARMLALAGWRLGIRFSFVACNEEETQCVDGLGRVVPWRSGDDIAQLYESLGLPDVVTVERESVCVELLKGLAQHCPVSPNPAAVTACQHRYREKTLLDELGIRNAEYRYASSNLAIGQAIAELDYPLILKAASDGYDGKQQWRLGDKGDYEAFRSQNTFDKDWIIERHISFEREVSFIGIRSSTGEIACYPATENVHSNGVLVHSSAPAEHLPSALQRRGEADLIALMEHLDYVGVLAMECFVMGEQLLVNELAPRVHNSGHWTQQAGVTCQFENHIRAIVGLPLGSTELRNFSGFVNILGVDPDLFRLENVPPQATVHVYNKPFAPGRKLGHVGVSADNRKELYAQLNRLQLMLGSRESESGKAL